MKRGDKMGQVWYFTSVMLVFIGFAFFGIFIIQNQSLTGSVIDNVDLPSACSDAEIMAVWASVFDVGSSGISIVKSDSTTGGRCSEYFANKSDTNEVNNTYFLYGYTKPLSGKNVTFVLAEKFNATNSYKTLLDGATTIDQASSLIVRDASFLSSYVQPRRDNITLNTYAETEFLSLFSTDSISLEIDNFFEDESFSFSQDVSTSLENVSIGGLVVGNYSYSFYSWTSFPIIVDETCLENITCEAWSDCINGSKKRLCIDANNCSASYNDSSSCSTSSCVPNWNIGNWSDCSGGIQTRSVFDLNNCLNATEKPVTNQTCVGEIACVPDWNCKDWVPDVCPETGIQERSCSDSNKCDSNFLTKTETQNCVFESGVNWILIFILFFIIAVILVGVLFLLKFIKKKEDEKIDEKINGSPSKSAMPLKNIPSKNSKSARPLVKKITGPVKRIVPLKIVPKLNTSNQSSKPQSMLPKLSPVNQNVSPKLPSPKPLKQVTPPPKSAGMPAKKNSTSKPATKSSIKSELEKIANSK